MTEARSHRVNTFIVRAIPRRRAPHLGRQRRWWAGSAGGPVARVTMALSREGQAKGREAASVLPRGPPWAPVPTLRRRAGHPPAGISGRLRARPADPLPVPPRRADLFRTYVRSCCTLRTPYLRLTEVFRRESHSRPARVIVVSNGGITTRLTIDS